MIDEARLPLEYVLPLKADANHDFIELGAYLGNVVSVVDVTVIDSSREAAFQAIGAALPSNVRHIRADSNALPGHNGKVINVMVGVRMSRHDHIVIADDDVRYRPSELRQMNALLGTFDLVRPQNYFASLPWHARWDTSRSLINRALGSDYPGTLGVRRSVLIAAGGYRSDVLFENLELIRTIRAAGGRECRADGLFVARIPSSTRKFFSQRVRQAYDDFAQPYRLGLELLVLPAFVASLTAPAVFLAFLLLPMVLAEAGRRRASGQSVFRPSSALWAPLWTIERALCVWVAIALRVRGGVPYGGARIRCAGSSMRQLAAKNQSAVSREETK